MLLTEEEMVFIRKLRMEYRVKVVTMRATGLLEDQKAFSEVQERRNRVIRSLYDEGMNGKQIQAVLGVSRHIVENALLADSVINV